MMFTLTFLIPRWCQCFKVMFGFVAISLCFAEVLGNQLMKSGNGRTVRENCLDAYNVMSPRRLSRYIDASGKPGSGIYGGNTLWFGSFSECNKLQKSRYCLATLSGIFEMGRNQTKVFQYLQWGICVPNVCTKENVIENLDYLLKNVSKIALKRTSNLGMQCAEDADYSAGVIMTIIFCGILISTCLIASFLEVAKVFWVDDIPEKNNLMLMEASTEEKCPLLKEKKKEQKFDPQKESSKTVCFHDILNCFSLIRNINSVLNTKVGKNDLTYLHGIRVLSLFWIILLHTALTPFFKDLPIDNPDDVVKDLTKRPASMVIINGALAVDTFFLLSGLLVVYVNLIKFEKTQGKMDWIRFYFHRFWRLTPSYMIAVLLDANIRPLNGDGPLLYKLRDNNSCSDYWWTNLLYINNFYPKGSTKQCLQHTWYLAADMQFFVLSPILILVFLRFGFRSFLALGSLVVLASMITTGVLIGTKDVSPVIIFKNGVIFRDGYFNDVYMKPYCRIQPYIIGMVLGGIIFINIKTKLRLKLNWVLVFWLLSIGTALVFVYSPYSANKDDPHVWTKGEKVLFGSSRWCLWGLCIAWVIFACQYGYAGLIKSILAEKFWIPLSRINYAAFILHYEVIYIVLYNIQTPLHFTTFTLVTLYLSILVLTYAIAFIFTTVAELPFANLEALYWSKKKRSLGN